MSLTSSYDVERNFSCLKGCLTRRKMSNRNNTYSRRCYGKSPPPPERCTGARKQHRSAQVGTNICQFSRYATEFGVNFKSVVHATWSSIRRNRMRFLRCLFLKTKQQPAATVLLHLWGTRRPCETASITLSARRHFLYEMTQQLLSIVIPRDASNCVTPNGQISVHLEPAPF